VTSSLNIYRRPGTRFSFRPAQLMEDLCLFLFSQVFCQWVLACVPPHIRVEVPAVVQAGYVLSRVNLFPCGQKVLFFTACDPDFTVLSDGTIVTRRVTRVTTEGKSFCVWAHEQGQQKWRVDVSLTHADEAPKAPVLKRFRRRWSPPPIYLKENTPGPYPKDLEQIGSDSSQNQTVYYRISGPGVDQHPVDVFKVETLSGMLSVLRPLDREEFPQTFLQFTARVFNKFTHKETDLPLPITVHIEDVNDNAPVATGRLQFTVVEQSPPGTVVGTINATDRDEPNTSHTKIKYSLLSSAELFTIHSFSGVITTRTSTLDRETQAKLFVAVELRDMGGASDGLSTTSTATILLTDINDNPPTFRETIYKGTVEENQADKLILRIPVDDKDLEGTPNWQAQGVSRVPLFQPLDHEKGAVVTLELVAQNVAPLVGTGASWRSVPVEVRVGNVDEGPEFSPPLLVLRVKENVPNGTLIGTYTAIDPETKSGNGITYYEESEPASWIRVAENTGELRTTNTIDRESKFVSNGTYNMTVRAVDESKKSGVGTVMIIIDDINDNVPFFPKSYVVLCEKEGQLGSVLLEAQDIDDDPYSAPFTFELGDAAEGKWKLKDAKDTSVVLQQATAMPMGEYEVPLLVKDRQGTGGEQVVRVKVCECVGTTGAEECVAQRRSVVLGVGAVLAMLLALALLLLLFLLFIFICTTKREKFYLDDNGAGMLLKSNTEAPGEEVDRDGLVKGGAEQTTLTSPTAFPGGHQTLQKSSFHTMRHEFSSATGHHDNVYGTAAHYGDGFYGDTGYVKYSDAFATWRTNELYLDRKIGYFGEEDEDRYAADLLKHYGYEGEGSPAGSVGCCSELGGDETLDFLDTLGPKFRTLAHICTHRGERE
uniref:Cadherin domain-containing protein n=1 Tax=Denticeps clupeoides TaxID=299321 RepID=A0AAY4CVC2_9TELE